MSTGQRKRSGNGHPNVWAFLTLATFPIVLIATDMLGLHGVWPFVYAILATLIVLALEGTIRGKLWPFEPHFAECLGHPDTPIRILLFLGGVLLILETSLIAIIALDRRTDMALIGFVARKECTAWHDPSSSSLCRRLMDEKRSTAAAPTVDGRSFAIRTRALQEWYPDAPLATCAVRQAASWTDTSSHYALAYAHCVSWSIDGQGKLKADGATTRYVAVNLNEGEETLPHVSGWSDDMNDPSWDMTLREHAEDGRDRVRSSSVLSDILPVLQAEAKIRAEAILQR
ncbi:hypothetical protein KJ781_03825 [Patescibacteria group bacterium]|nr:hypothetical protein [Patescibacteria group bacterium]MBU1448547.1 hypothetical protein [Patescibacteria group bacterium]MBU2613593.1 hypothetical protein [Patescibacteria group bacterium]